MGLFKKDRPFVANGIETPVDLNTPVRNDKLVRAIEAYRTAPEKLRSIVGLEIDRELPKANFLLATLHAHPDGDPPLVDGTMRAGSTISIFNVVTGEETRWLALFTDWESLYASCGEGSPWVGMVNPARDALRLGNGYSGGAVINPSGPKGTLPLPAGTFDRFLSDP